jgi:hypothetical protein
MGLMQRWLLGLITLGAGYMVLNNPSGFYKATEGLRRLTAGSVVSVTTGGKGNVQ